MEWLINRRRMMFYRAIPPVYMNFEDQRIWEICCYNWGDTELVTGEIASGNITADGSALVYSDYVYASCLAIPQHKLGNGSTISAKAAAAQTFSVTITITDNDPFANQSDGDTVLQIVQHTQRRAAGTSLADITKADWVSGNENGVYAVSVTTTSACQYLRVGALATSGITVNWSINAVSGNYQPVGITEKQCNAVTSFGSVLRNIATDLRFTECRYFRVTNLSNSSPLQNDIFVRIKFPQTLIKIDFYSNYFTSCEILDIPASTTTIDYFYGGRRLSSLEVFILRPNKAFTSVGYVSEFKSDIKIFVPESFVDEYKASSDWSARANNIYAIEGSEYETFNDWEYSN